MDAEQAVKYGLVDQVIYPDKSSKSKTNKKK
jgi:ATP-dependent protease ClpP protease subunit